MSVAHFAGSACPAASSPPALRCWRACSTDRQVRRELRLPVVDAPPGLRGRSRRADLPAVEERAPATAGGAARDPGAAAPAAAIGAVAWPGGTAPCSPAPRRFRRCPRRTPSFEGISHADNVTAFGNQCTPEGAKGYCLPPDTVGGATSAPRTTFSS